MNEVILIGRLTKDVEIRQRGEMTVARMTIAVDRGDKSKSTDFLNVIVFDKQAENCGKYLAKGRQVAIAGRIQTGSYEKADGTKVYTTEIVANRVEFLGSKNDSTVETPKGFSEAEEDIPF